MPATTTAATAAAAVAENSLRTLGFDLKSLLTTANLQTFGILAVIVLGILLIFDFFNYGYTSYAYGDTSSYSSYGRSLITSAAKVWDQRDQLGFSNHVRGGRGMDSMTKILDDIADAILKYEEVENNNVGQSRESKVL
ncbi:uncharacterized protein LOC125040897 [Penaeus chinensis]|uniref:uncharacterized protein LOC125040897 n=1 Tax=Penaeus chinensis TaxID=139456 RepID=UPI001FB7DE21|nr:uncharacterized protein LOC125040897 [Penaeus chinensis]